MLILACNESEVAAIHALYCFEYNTAKTLSSC